MRGFTLIELLVVLAILGLLVAGAEPSYRTFVQQTTSQETSVVYVQTLRRALLLAHAGYQDAPWGVQITPTRIILFKGTTYASRDTRYDEVYTVTGSVSVSGVSDVSFSPLTGVPTVYGTTTIISEGFPPTNIFVNEKGTVLY